MQAICIFSGDRLLFDPASEFRGAKPGYSFKLGPHGLGYYDDSVRITTASWHGPGCFEAAVEVDADGPMSGMTGFWLWPASERLSELLCISSTSGVGPLAVGGRKVLELGAGCGLVSAVASLLGASEVIATDRSALLPRLRATAALRGGCQRFDVQELVWGEGATPLSWPCGYFDIILGSDITYQEFQPLHELLWQLANNDTMIVLAHGVRGQGQAAVLWSHVCAHWPNGAATVLSGNAALCKDGVDGEIEGVRLVETTDVYSVSTSAEPSVVFMMKGKPLVPASIAQRISRGAGEQGERIVGESRASHARGGKTASDLQ